MPDQSDAPEDRAPEAPLPEQAAAKALPPKVWVTGLILLVLVLLAVFGLT
jgi:hypothetical protein